MARAVRQGAPMPNRGEVLAAEVDHAIDRLQEAESASRKATASIEELVRVAETDRR